MTLVAVDDFVETPFETAINIDVLANDITDDPPMIITSASDPPNGSTLIELDDTITYTPDDEFSGIDTFAYFAEDDAFNFDIGDVTVTVGAGGVPPRRVTGAVVSGALVTSGLVTAGVV